MSDQKISIPINAFIHSISNVHEFKNVNQILADTRSSGYGAGSVWTTSEGYRYEEADNSALDHHIITTGGVKLYVQTTNSSINVKAFGAMGDGITDDTLALQNAINYAAPYVWQGSVGLVNSSQQVKCALFIPIGNYRITQPLLLSKGLRIYGETGSGFFTSTNQSVITADFDAMDRFILDTAPYNSDGERVLSASYNGTAFDNGLVSTTNSIILERILIRAGTDRTILGGLNMTASSQSSVSNCGILDVNVGIRLTASWAGNFSNNHIDVKAQGIYCNSDVTIWDIQNNYITVRNTPSIGYIWPAGEVNAEGVPTNAGFSGGTEIFENYACILLKFSNPVIKNNTLERGNIGIASESGFASNMYSNYMELIKEFCYALNTNDANIIGGYTTCSDAKLLYADGSADQSIILDFTGIKQFVIQQNAFQISTIESITFKVKKSTPIYLHSRVNIIVPEHETNINTINLSSAGNDLNNGLSTSYPVLTLQEAFLRIRPGMNNEIVIPSGETVTTKHSFGSNDSNSYFIPNTSLTIKSSSSGKATITVGTEGDTIHALQMESGNLRLQNIIFNISTATNGDYRPFIIARGVLTIDATDCNFIGGGATTALFGSRYNISSTLFICSNACVFQNLTFLRIAQSNNDGSGTTSVIWTETNSGSTFTDVALAASANTHKIISKNTFTVV